MCLIRLERWGEAEKALENAIRLDPGNVIFMTNLGYLYSRTGKFGESLKYLGKAIKIDPEHVRALTTRGSVRRIMKDYEGSIRDHTEAYLQRGTVYFEQKEWKNAASDFSDFLKRHKDPDMDFKAALFNLGWCYHELLLYPRAIQCWEGLIELGYRPDDMKMLIFESKMRMKR